MSARVMISLEEYARTSYPDLDREYVRGEVVERTMPVPIHGRVQSIFGALFFPFSKSHRLYAYSEARVRLAPDLVRIPDVLIMAGGQPAPFEAIATPPLVVIEILSPDDRWSAVVEKCKEYEAFGVPHIFLVDLLRRALVVYSQGRFEDVAAFTISGYPVSITAADLFDQ